MKDDHIPSLAPPPLDNSDETFARGVRNMARELRLTDRERAGELTDTERAELLTLRQQRQAEMRHEHDVLTELTGRPAGSTGKERQS